MTPKQEKYRLYDLQQQEHIFDLRIARITGFLIGFIVGLLMLFLIP